MKVLDKLKERYGEQVFVDKDSEEKLDVISTGATSIDISTGIGGIPKGKLTELFGPRSSGKTTLALSICREAIKNGDSVLYVDVEHTLTYHYAEAVIGDFDKEKLIIAHPEHGEDALTIARMGTESGEFGVIVLDSVGALSPKKEKEKDIEDHNISLSARMIGKFLRMTAYVVKENNVALIFINQVRANIGMFTFGYGKSGGNALDHYISLEITLTPTAKKDWPYRGKKENKDYTGIRVRFTISKNKLAPPFRSASFPIIFGEGIDFEDDLIEFGLMLGILEQRGAYIAFEGNSIGQGRPKTIKALLESPELVDKIVKACYNSLGIEKQEKENGTDK